MFRLVARRDKQQAEERSLAAVDELAQEKQQNREELAVVRSREGS